MPKYLHQVFNTYRLTMPQIAKLFIEGAIGEADPFVLMFGGDSNTFSAADCARFIAENKDADEYHVEIRSQGGNVEAGFDIYDQLKATGKPITTIGYKVQSIATVIFLAGSTRQISENSQPVVHSPRIDGGSLQGANLTAEDLTEIASEVEACEKRMVNFYCKVLGLSGHASKDLQALMKEDRSMSAAEFKEWGFATEIIKTNQKAATTKAIGYSHKIAAIVTESKKQNNTMSEIKDIKTKLSGFQNLMNSIAKKLGIKAEGEVVATSAEGKDGSKIYFEGDAVAVDTPVFSDEAMTIPVADGDIEMADGSTITVAGGLVTTITPAEDAEEAATVEALTTENETLKGEVKALKKQVAVLATTKKDFIAMSKQFNEFLAAVPGDTHKHGGNGGGGDESSPAKKHLDHIRNN